MKKKNLFRSFVLCFILLSFYPLRPVAQTIVPASNTDLTVFSAPLVWANNPPYWINSSVMEWGSVGQCVRAIVWDDGKRPSFILSNDGVNWSLPIPLNPPPGFVASYPDIIIGGNNNINGYYDVGVVYRASNPVSSGIYFDTYRMGAVGSTVMPPFVWNPCTGLNIYTSNTYSGIPNADIITGNSFGIPGNLWTDQFFLTWEEGDCGGAGSLGAMACVGSLDKVNHHCTTVFYTKFAPSCINGGTNVTNVDVAAQQYDPGTGVIRIARFTWYDRATGELYYNDWDETNGVVGTPVSIADATAGNPTGQQRIDAIDPYDASTPSTAPYNIAFESKVSVTTPFSISSYNMSNPFGGIDCSTTLLGANDNTKPVIASGAASDYYIGYHSNSTTPTDDMYVQTIGWASGVLSNSGDCMQANTAVTATSPMSVSNDYWWNTGSSLAEPASTMAVWYDPATLTIYHKVTTAGPPAYKSTGVNSIDNKLKFQVSPNPATDVLIIHSAGAIKGYIFSITDITGKKVKEGAIGSDNEEVNVSGLAKGMYLLHVGSKNNTTETVKFVKN